MVAVLGLKNRQIDTLRHELALAKHTAEARKLMVEEARVLQKAVSDYNQVLKVTVTAYNAEEGQTDADPLIAASMRKVREGTVAVSRDLFDQGWVFGKKIRIEGLGIFEINDLMNKRYKKRVDVFMWDKDQARAFGKRVFKAALLSI
jgi:3D (Asp-Asp-Asp) domain-containing protein